MMTRRLAAAMHAMIAWAVACLLATVVVQSAYAQEAGQGVGVMKSAEGTVIIHRAGKERVASVGDDVLEHDRISTGPASSCGLVLTDGTTVALGANAEVEIADYAFEPSRGIFDLVLRALSGHFIYGSGRIGEARPDRVRIETPFLSVGTRGTRFAVVLPGASR